MMPTPSLDDVDSILIELKKNFTGLSNCARAERRGLYGLEAGRPGLDLIPLDTH
jgi:hypothetical protein